MRMLNIYILNVKIFPKLAYTIAHLSPQVSSLRLLSLIDSRSSDWFFPFFVFPLWWKSEERTEGCCCLEDCVSRLSFSFPLFLCSPVIVSLCMWACGLLAWAGGQCAGCVCLWSMTFRESGFCLVFTKLISLPSTSIIISKPQRCWGHVLKLLACALPSGLHGRVPLQSCQSERHLVRGGKTELE